MSISVCEENICRYSYSARDAFHSCTSSFARLIRCESRLFSRWRRRDAWQPWQVSRKCGIAPPSVRRQMWYLEKVSAFPAARPALVKVMSVRWQALEEIPLSDVRGGCVKYHDAEAPRTLRIGWAWKRQDRQPRLAFSCSVRLCKKRASEHTLLPIIVWNDFLRCA